MMWLAFIASFILGGLSFPGMFWRDDEWPLLKQAMNLKVKDADGDKSDGIEEAWDRLAAPGRFLHDLKNIGHEWVKSNPKVAFKGGGFMVLVLVVLLVVT
jgi:hypothetical protein